MNNFFTTFFNEKNLDSQYYTVNSPNGTPNIIPSTVVIDAIKNTQGEEAAKIKDMLIKIDFLNGNIHNYLQHLAQALTKDLDI